MGTLADSLFTVLMSWVRALVSGIWALFSSEDTTLLGFLGKNWMIVAGVIIAAGLVIDWLIWLIRWQPYHIWAQRARRFLGIVQEEEEKPALKARAAVARGRSMPVQPFPADEPQEAVREEYAGLDDEDERLAEQRANSVPDEALGAYPGMRYGAQAAGLGGTHRFSALTSEGPGAAEVERRRAEIEAWQQQMQDEARARARAEREAREQEEAQRRQEAEERMRAEEERRQAAWREAEAARLAQEEAEAARLAQEEAEAARLAQEEYERQLAEYERQKAQYERDLAEYERRKAEYEAQLAEQAQQRAQQSVETAQEAAPAVPRRRRATGHTIRMSAVSEPVYSDYLDGETVEALPAPPVWPEAKKTAQKAAAKKKKPVQKQKAPEKEHKLLSRMAHMIEPEDEELASIGALPPRVDMHEAYKPAKKPPKPGRSR